MAKISVVSGSELSAKELQLINKYRKEEFNSQNPIQPRPDNPDWRAPYFLLKENLELVAFGRLHSIEIMFRDVNYQILGIASVIAVIKGRGYGSALMSAMKSHIEQDGRSAIGFCSPNVSSFYEKCGFSIINAGKSRFVFMDNGKRLPLSNPQDDVLCVDGRDGLTREVLKHRNEVVTAFKHPW